MRGAVEAGGLDKTEPQRHEEHEKDTIAEAISKSSLLVFSVSLCLCGESLMSRRAAWTDLSDAQLLAQCEVDTYRASGPGGQKRNKTSSAVRLRHPPSGLIVIAEESRSQHENRARALRRLRQALYLKLREDCRRRQLTPEPGGAAGLRRRPATARAGCTWAARTRASGRRSGWCWTCCRRSRRGSARRRRRWASRPATDRFPAERRKVWEQANQLRSRFGHKPLR